MPFIHIKSLPLEQDIDIPDFLSKLNQDFSAQTGIQLEHIHSTWEMIKPGFYAKGNNVPETQPVKNHPILVDILTPDFNDLKIIALMLECTAASISRFCHHPRDNIFINHRHARSSMVFDDGAIVQW